jgi:hypothetical protein
MTRAPCVTQELDAAVDVPAEHEDRVLRLLDRLVETAEVRVAVDEAREAAGAGDLPAVLAFPEDRSLGLHRRCAVHVSS